MKTINSTKNSTLNKSTTNDHILPKINRISR